MMRTVLLVLRLQDPTSARAGFCRDKFPASAHASPLAEQELTTSVILSTVLMDSVLSELTIANAQRLKKTHVYIYGSCSMQTQTE